MSVEKWITEALKYSGGTHTLDDIKECLFDGSMQLFVNKRGCAVTQITQYPRKKVLFIFLAGGELDGVLDLHDEVIEFAKERKCDTLTMIGRKGWAKALKKHEWRDDAVCMTRGV